MLIGVVLSAPILGNLAPAVHDRLFVGGGEIARQLEQRMEEHEQNIQALRETGVTEPALDEHRQRFEQEIAPLQLELEQQRRARAGELGGLAHALIVAVFLVMVGEALVGPRPSGGGRVAVPPALSRLITVRYALIAGWLALAIAQPGVLRGVPVVFLLLLLVVAGVIAFMPLGRRAQG